MGDSEKCPVCKRVATRSFWIECEKCLRWFHGDCVGFKSKMEADKLECWVCPMCPTRNDIGTETDFNYDPGTFVVVCVCQNFTVNNFAERSVITCTECRKWYDKKCIRMNENNNSIICPSCCSSLQVNLEVKKMVHKSSQTVTMVKKGIADKSTDTVELEKKMVHSFSQTILGMKQRTVDKGTDPIDAQRKMIDNFSQTEKNTSNKPLSRLSLSSQQKNGVFKTSSQPAVLPRKQIVENKRSAACISQSSLGICTQGTKSGYNSCMKAVKHKSTAASQSKSSDEELSGDDFLPKKKHGK